MNLALLGGEFFQQNPASDPQIYGALGEKPDLFYSLLLKHSDVASSPYTVHTGVNKGGGRIGVRPPLAQ